MAWTVNLVAAFLTLLAIGFYVVVYTMCSSAARRRTSSSVAPRARSRRCIGWAAVTGNVALPALLLFLIVFYWTPPHFWALALRIRGDYAAAGVPMLPVVRGIAETSRQIGLYTILLVALTVVFARRRSHGSDLRASLRRSSAPCSSGAPMSCGARAPPPSRPPRKQFASTATRSPT